MLAGIAELSGRGHPVGRLGLEDPGPAEFNDGARGFLDHTGDRGGRELFEAPSCSLRPFA